MLFWVEDVQVRGMIAVWSDSSVPVLNGTSDFSPRPFETSTRAVTKCAVGFVGISDLFQGFVGSYSESKELSAI